MEVSHNGWTYNLEVSSYYPGRPAKLHAAPEDCYPEEDAEIEFMIVSIEPDGDHYSLDDLLNDEQMAVLLLTQAEEE